MNSYYYFTTTFRQNAGDIGLPEVMTSQASCDQLDIDSSQLYSTGVGGGVGGLGMTSLPRHVIGSGGGGGYSCRVHQHVYSGEHNALHEALYAAGHCTVLSPPAVHVLRAGGGGGGTQHYHQQPLSPAPSAGNVVLGGTHHRHQIAAEMLFNDDASADETAKNSVESVDSYHVRFQA